MTGMTSLVRRNKPHPNAADPRVNALLARKPFRLVTVAMANQAQSKGARSRLNALLARKAVPVVPVGKGHPSGWGDWGNKGRRDFRPGAVPQIGPGLGLVHPSARSRAQDVARPL